MCFLEKPPDILIFQGIKKNPAVLIQEFEDLLAQNVILLVKECELFVSLISNLKAFFRR
jgi:hypothetical protein